MRTPQKMISTATSWLALGLLLVALAIVIVAVAARPGRRSIP